MLHLIRKKVYFPFRDYVLRTAHFQQFRRAQTMATAVICCAICTV